VTVTFVSDDVAGPPRVAYTVSRRVGGAVVRNRVRRRLRAIVEEEAARLPSGAYLIGVAPTVASASFGELRSCMRQAFDKLALPEP
jgi:ribonuclease P protein component